MKVQRGGAAPLRSERVRRSVQADLRLGTPRRRRVYQALLVQADSRSSYLGTGLNAGSYYYFWKLLYEVNFVQGGRRLIYYEGFEEQLRADQPVRMPALRVDRL